MAARKCKSCRTHFDEHQRQIETQGFADKSNGERYYEVVTPYGKVGYITNPEMQKKIFRNMTVLYMLHSIGFRFEYDNREDFAVNSARAAAAEKDIKDVCDASDVEFIDKTTEKAVEYFGTNLGKMFFANLEKYVDEAFFYAVIKVMDEQDCKLTTTEVQAYKQFVKSQNVPLKERLDIQKASGRRSSWTDAELQGMLAEYDSILPLIAEAKKIYRTVGRKSGWVNSIKALYPDLPSDVIEQFAQRGVPPASLALEMTARRFGTQPTEYLRQLIIKTRKTSPKRSR